MAELAGRLGLKPGQSVLMVDAPPDDADILRAAAPERVDVQEQPDGGKYAAVFFWPTTLEGFGERLRELSRLMVPAGAVWVILPRKEFAARYGVGLTWGEMQQAALAQGDLVDNRTASFSSEKYATRFVIRREARPFYVEGADPNAPRLACTPRMCANCPGCRAEARLR